MRARRFLSEEVLKVNYDPKPREVKENIEQKLMRLFGTTPAEATRDQVYKAVAHTVKDILADKRTHFSERVKKTGEKQVYYMCMEFLLGSLAQKQPLQFRAYRVLRRGARQDGHKS